MSDAVLFDLDGVLIDSRGPIAACTNATLAAFGLPERAPEELHGYIGPPLHETFVMLVGAERADACVAHYRALYAERAPHETPIFDGIAELLDALAGRPLAIATSKPQGIAEPLVEALGLRSHFAAVIGPPLDKDHTKTETIGRALHALGVADATMIGDRSFDIIGARAHGLRSIGALWGIGGEAELRAAGADALAPTPAAVLPLLS